MTLWRIYLMNSQGWLPWEIMTNKEWAIMWEKRRSCGLKLDCNDTEYFYSCRNLAPRAFLGIDGQQELVAYPELWRMGDLQGERLEMDELVPDCQEKFSVLHASWYLENIVGVREVWGRKAGSGASDKEMNRIYRALANGGIISRLR